MTPDERAALNDAEEQVFQTQQEFDAATETSGIQPPPTIEETESVLEPQLFGLWFGGQPESEIFPVSTVPPSPACPSVSVTFSGVLIDCGCLPGDLGTSERFDDISFNTTYGPLTKQSSHSDCTDCYRLFQGTCKVRSRYWGVNGSCSGTPTTEYSPDSSFEIALVLKSGVYYLMAIIVPNGFLSNAVVFSGSTTDLSSPITNTVSCLAPPAGFDFPCDIFSGVDFFGAGHGGTATIS